MQAGPSNRSSRTSDSDTAPPRIAPHQWTFLTNHGHVLLVIATTPNPLVEDIAATVGITPRATLQILKDLEDSGYLHRFREGRRTRYTIDPHQHFRHPTTSQKEIGELLAIFAHSPGSGQR